MWWKWQKGKRWGTGILSHICVSKLSVLTWLVSSLTTEKATYFFLLGFAQPSPSPMLPPPTKPYLSFKAQIMSYLLCWAFSDPWSLQGTFIFEYLQTLIMSLIPSDIFDTLQTLHSAFQFVTIGILILSSLSYGHSCWGQQAPTHPTHSYSTLSAVGTAHMPLCFFITTLQAFSIPALQRVKPKTARGNTGQVR